MFHLKRYADQITVIKTSKDTILSQEQLIKNLSESIKRASSNGPKLTKELKMHL